MIMIKLINICKHKQPFMRGIVIKMNDTIFKFKFSVLSDEFKQEKYLPFNNSDKLVI